MKEWQLDSLRYSLKTETEEVEKVNDERRAQKEEMLAQYNTVMTLSQKLNESQDTVDELVGELVEAERAKDAVLSEAFDSLEKAESRQGQITELQEENRALKSRCQSDKEVQAFRRTQPGEVPVLRETVSYERSGDANPSQYERSRSRSDQMLKEVRQNADRALRMTVDQAALDRAV